MMPGTPPFSPVYFSIEATSLWRKGWRPHFPTSIGRLAGRQRFRRCPFAIVSLSDLGRPRGFKHKLKIQDDLNLIAHNYTPRIHRSVPFDAVILPVHRCGSVSADAGLASHPFDNKGCRNIKTDLFRDSAHREVADQVEIASSNILDALRFKPDCRVGSCIEEIGTAQISIALLLSSIDGGDFNHRFSLYR